MFKFSHLNFFLLVTVCLESYGASRYAEKCAQEIGVRVPPVDCKAPNGSEVPVGNRADGRCDNPSHGLSECNPGTKFIRYVDTFRRPGSNTPETVTTMIMCRKTNEDMSRRGGAADDQYSDIGVIQYNETRHATCWFAKTGNNIPSVTLPEGKRIYPSPSSRDENFWGNAQPPENCLACHQNNVWLASPFALGVDPLGKGYQGTGTGRYTEGTGNNIPRGNPYLQISKRGPSCSVGRPTWNTRRGNGNNLINGDAVSDQIKINSNAYNAEFPANPPVSDGVASSGNCTECHYMGRGGNNMACRTLLNSSSGESHSLSRDSNSVPFVKRFWMPPRHGETQKAGYDLTYGRALAAIRWCCTADNSTNRYRTICKGDRFSRGSENSILTNLNTNGSCALCPNCGGEPVVAEEPRRNKDSDNLNTTH